MKHAFTDNKTNSQIIVGYETDGPDWRLSIADNGVGKSNDVPTKAGLGTNIVNALARQLNARVEVVSSVGGTTLSVVHTAPLHATEGPSS